MIYASESKYEKTVMMSLPNGGKPIVCDAKCQETNKDVENVKFFNTLLHTPNWSPIPTIITAFANIFVMLWLIKYFYDKLKVVTFKGLKLTLLIADVIYIVLNSICIFFVLFHSIIEKGLTGE